MSDSTPGTPATHGAPVAPQAVGAPLARSAVFLTLEITDDGGALDTVREVLSNIDGLVKTVGFRDLEHPVSCTVGIGSRVWTELTGRERPAELHPFREIVGAAHTAVATPGDLLFHIWSDRQDLCFELERLLLDALGPAVTTADEVSGFRYFDTRDLLGFVDGTANPVGAELPEATLVGDEDPAFAGGRAARRRRVRHVLHRLLAPAVGHRADAGAHVRRGPAWPARPDPRLLDPADRLHVLRAAPDAARRPVGAPPDTSARRATS